MAVPTFNGRIVIQLSTPINATRWNIVFDFFDASGTYSGFDVTVGHIVYIDTSVVLSGSLSKYRVSSINSRTAFSVDCNIDWVDVGDPQDPAFGVGIDQVILQETLHGYDQVPSPGVQALPDRYAVYPQNFSFQKVDLDITGITGILGGGSATGSQGVTGSRGFTGVQGTQGFTGSQGITGFGLQGSTGIKGSTGLQGLPGSDGLNGPTGIQGTTGAAGSGATGASGNSPLTYTQQVTLNLYSATDQVSFQDQLKNNLFLLPNGK